MGLGYEMKVDHSGLSRPQIYFDKHTIDITRDS